MVWLSDAAPSLRCSLAKWLVRFTDDKLKQLVNVLPDSDVSMFVEEGSSGSQ
jgi:4-diphosphocytidyl-2C-methyl-D-erythritol kinase